MKTLVVSVTPDVAKEYLSTNEGNRRVSKATVRTYAEKMRDGLWQLTHQGIAFDEQGLLLDGQHRLLAVVESGVTVDMTVTFGAARATFVNLDTQNKRQASQLLGIPNASTAAAGLRVLIALENNGHLNTAGRIGNELVLQALDRYPEVERAAQIAALLRPWGGGPTGAHTAVMTQALRSVYAHRVPSWVSGIHDGAGLGLKSPILLLRNRFMGQPASKVGSQALCYSLIAKAWNAHAQDREVGTLKMLSSESTPVIVGLQS